MNANVLNAFEKFEYYKIPKDQAYVAVYLENNSLTIEQAIERLGNMTTQKYPFKNKALFMRDYLWIFKVDTMDIVSIFKKFAGIFNLDMQEYPEKIIKKFDGHGISLTLNMPNLEGNSNLFNRFGFQLGLSELKVLGRDLPKEKILTFRSQVNVFSDYVYDHIENRFICLKPFSEINRKDFNSKFIKFKQIIDQKQEWRIPCKGEYMNNSTETQNNVLDNMSEEIDENGFRACSEREALYLKQEKNEQ